MDETRNGTLGDWVAGQPQQARGRDALMWVIAAGLLLAGVGGTTLGLILPADADQFFWARTIATASGVLLTALSGAVVTYVMTRAVTVADVERRYIGVLDRIARSLAHVYANLHLATSQRRAGAYSHEETYQEVVLAGASTVLAEFDSVTRLSGSISGAFSDSRRDLDEIRKVFASQDPVIVQALTATRLTPVREEAKPVSALCPVCQSRVRGLLALRPGWTSNVQCENCGSRFNLHRRGDLTVYASRPLSTDEGRTPTTSPSLHQMTDSVASDAESVMYAEIECPSCKSTYRISYRAKSLRENGELHRVCVSCGCVYRADPTSGSIIGFESGQVHRTPVVSRKSSYAILECPVDKRPIAATFASRSSSDWHAFCPVHLVVAAVSRQIFRDWLEANDPEFLAYRLDLELEGGSLIISDPK